MATTIQSNTYVGRKIIEALGIDNVTEAKLVVGVEQLMSAQVTVILTQEQINKIFGEG